MPFQSAVNMTQAPAMEGDFASANPRSNALAEQGAYVAGTAGVTIGRWCWEDSQSVTVANTGTGAPTGFLARTGQVGSARITAYLAETSNVIPAGFDVTLHKSGDFWVKNAGAGAVTKQMKAFANLSNGTTSFAAAGATVAGAIETKFFSESTGAASELIRISNVPLG